MHQFDINIKNISKIEGHTHLDAKVKDGKVVECKLKISENKRFFTQAILGKDINIVPSTMSRICGTCSAAHALCSTEAIEKALKLDVSEQTSKLRHLLTNAGHLRDHAMHLYFFCLPDLYNKDSILDFKSEEEHQLVHDGLDIKEAGNYLSTIIGGRAVHPPNTVIGGFIKLPTKQEIQEARKKIKSIREKVLKIIDIFSKQKEVFKRKINYVGLINYDYNFLQGAIKTSYGTTIQEEDYAEHLERIVLPYSTATAFTWESVDYMVGALARLNLNKKNLHEKTKKDAEKYLKMFPSDNIFYNNLAQAIEMLHIIDTSIEILNALETDIKSETPVKIKLPKKQVTGVGVIEAPRGTLYYRLDINPEGKIIFADLCIPTQQNIIHMEKGIAGYIEKLLQNNFTKQQISLEIEKMIRAYDPCMSCATHFLKINWI